MNNQEIESIIRDACPTCYNIITVDSMYQLIQESDINRKWWEVWSKYIWRKESWDCDEMAFAEMLRVRRKFSQDVMAAAIGVVGGILSNIYATPHAANIVILKTGHVKFWDYQSQTFYEPGKADKIRFCLI